MLDLSWRRLARIVASPAICALAPPTRVSGGSSHDCKTAISEQVPAACQRYAAFRAGKTCQASGGLEGAGTSARRQASFAARLKNQGGRCRRASGLKVVRQQWRNAAASAEYPLTCHALAGRCAPKRIKRTARPVLVRAVTAGQQETSQAPGS